MVTRRLKFTTHRFLLWRPGIQGKNCSFWSSSVLLKRILKMLCVCVCKPAGFFHVCVGAFVCVLLGVSGGNDPPAAPAPQIL